MVFAFARVASMLLVLAVIRNAVSMADTRFEAFRHSSCSNNERCDVEEASTGYWRVVNCQGQRVGVLEEDMHRKAHCLYTPSAPTEPHKLYILGKDDRL
jgi:hypothetical protein